MMKISGQWLSDPATQGLMMILESAGHQILFVGGCVRNAVLGVPVSDIDLATSAMPQDVTALAKAAGLRVVPTGIDHGTVTVISGGIPHEVTTFRRDVRTDGRHAVVAFSTDVFEDAARRDFTMNALYADRKGNLVDPLAGVEDAKAGLVRFVGDPEARICEDYLRILRFFRFFAHYGSPENGLDADGLAACAQFADKISTLSRERVGAELRKLLSAKDPAPAVASMAATGVLSQTLPGADARYLGVLVHLEAGFPVRWMRRLALIGAENPTDSLRLSRAEQRDFSHIRAEMAGTQSPAALGWTAGQDLAEDIVLCRSAMFEQPLPPDWQAEIRRGVAAECPVTAADFQDRFSGPALGKVLKDAQRRWLASNLILTRKELLL